VSNPLKGKHVLSVDQFDRETLDFLFGLTDRMRGIVERGDGCDALIYKQLALLFYQPSSRTRNSFEAAMKRLGGNAEVTNNVQFSSVSKGESLPDTIRTLGSYTDAIVLRHPKTGAARVAAKFSPVPIINGGDGIGEHPTQALLDMYTICNERNCPNGDGLTVGMIGDLRYGRTIHSLAELLRNYNDITLLLVSPYELRFPLRLKNRLEEMGMQIKETDDLEVSIPDMDVAYSTRIQEEHMTPKAYERVKGTFLITPQTMELAKPDMVLMHPLPRKTEVDWDDEGKLRVIHEGSIAYEVDQDTRAAYFRQMENGMYLRMALLASILGGLDKLPTYRD